MKSIKIASAAVAFALALTACGGSGSGDKGSGGFTAPDVPMAKSLGEGEGSVSIWPGPATQRTEAPTRPTTG